MPKFLLVLRALLKELSVMSMFDSSYSPSCVLNEQIARQVFDILPEDGPMMVIISKQGSYWPSNAEGFTQLNITDGYIKELCAKVDDGAEPIITNINDFSLIVTALATERSDCGYIMIVLPQYSPESTMANIGLIEILLSQVGLIAHLIEQNNMLYERQIKQLVTCGHADSESVLN
jgi:hypothetical protein